MSEISRRGPGDRAGVSSSLPMSRHTRLQKRYILEPVYTTLWVSGWTLSTISFLFAIWGPVHAKFVLTAVVFLVIGTIAAICKGTVSSLNIATEGTVTNYDR